MVEPIPTQTRPETTPLDSPASTSKPHLVSGADAIDAAGREVHLNAILARGDIRDQAAERRDRRADRRPRTAGDGQALTDRDWAGRDRDAAAADRADLIGLMHEQQGVVLVIDKAQGILMTRRGCTPQEAFTLLSDAAQENELTVDELAECIVADVDLR
jgi:hypothetical protein